MSSPPYMPPYKPPPYAPYAPQQYPPNGYPQQQESPSGGRYANQKRNRNDRKKNNDENQEPIHTVFFYNLPFDMEERDVRNFVNQFGTVADFFAIMPKGYAFVTYNDFREAVNAKEHGSNREVGSEGKTKRVVQVNYAYAKEGNRKAQITRCATITLYANPSITIDNARDACSAFGEIRAIRNGEKENTFVVKFFKLSDTKSIVEAKSVRINEFDCKVEYKFGEDEGALQRDSDRKQKNHNSNNSKGNHHQPNHQGYQNQPPLPPPPYGYPGQPPPPPQYPYPNYPYPPQYAYPGQPPPPPYQYPPGYPYAAAPPPPQYGMPPQGYPGVPPRQMQPPVQPPPPMQLQQPPMPPPVHPPPQQPPQPPQPPTPEPEEPKEDDNPRKKEEESSQGLLQLLAESLNNL